MSKDAAHESWWQISEVVFGIPFLVAIVLQFTVPLSLPVGAARLIVVVAGVALILAGIALVVQTRREFARHGENTDPGHPTRQVMTTGVFSISRNPLYLGIVIFLAGVALATNSGWVLVMLVPGIVACHYVLIAPEERYLTGKFGEEYSRYKRSVRRWVGRVNISNQ
ncbi:MAG TPA: isoprenylcysteine carboxylmethyltransferase family protein [Anaerolineales bacterium]